MWSCRAWLAALALACGCAGGTRLIRDGAEYQAVLAQVHEETKVAFASMRNGKELSPEESQALYDADQDLDALIAFAPDRYGLHILKSLVQRGLGKPEAARRSLEQALVLAPKEPTDDDRAALSQAHTQLSADAFEGKDYALAAEHAREATLLAPEDPEAHANLASALIQLQKLPEARKALARALELDPGFERARQMLRLVEGR